MKARGVKAPGVKAPGMKARGVRTAVVLACTVAVGLLAGCGKKGPPDPPGPPADIIYPKTYPTR